MVKDAVDTLKTEVLTVTSLVAEALAPTTLGHPAFTTNYNAAHTPLWTRIMGVSRQRGQADRPRGMGKCAVSFTSVMSHAKAEKAIVDAGLRAQSVDSGLPKIYGRDDVEYVKCSDEHGVVADPDQV